MENSTKIFTSALTRQLESQGLTSTKKLKLIIHVGTPKTGTTSLQTYLDKKQRTLRGKGILYPHNLEKFSNPTAPKHQWIEKNLITTHTEYFLENFANIISQVKDDTHTIILSSEGIYNHWWDFPDQSKDLLKALSKLFEINIWVWFRAPLEFIESYYKQCIRNPQIDNNPCYGKDLSLAEMLELTWFSRHLNYHGFVSDCQAVFGKDAVSPFDYDGDVVQEVIEQLGLASGRNTATLRRNKSLGSASIELLRNVNQYNITAKDKELLIPHLKGINEILENYGNQSLIDDRSRKRVLELFKPLIF